MFAYLIQQRIEEPSFHLIFFDQAVRIMNELGLNSLTTDKRFQLTSSSPSDKHIMTLNEKDIDTLLCDLVICFNMAITTFSPTRKPLTLTDIIKARKQKHLNSSNSFDGNIILNNSNDNNSNNDNPPKKVYENRTELSNIEVGIDLQLDDFWKGPLILPGPSKSEHMEDIILSTEDSYSHSPPLSITNSPMDDLEFEIERPSSIKFKYSTGWPDLNISRLNTKQNSFKKGYEILQNIRIKSIEKVIE